MFQYRTRVTTVVIAMALACAAWGQEPPSNRVVAAGDIPAPGTPPTFLPAFKDADFSSIAQVVGDSTGRTFVVGPGVCAQISATWETALTEEEFYQAFVSIARTLGFMVAEQGSITTITLDDHAGKDAQPSCRRYLATA